MGTTSVHDMLYSHAQNSFRHAPSRWRAVDDVQTRIKRFRQIHCAIHCLSFEMMHKALVRVMEEDLPDHCRARHEYARHAQLTLLVSSSHSLPTPMNSASRSRPSLIVMVPACTCAHSIWTCDACYVQCFLMYGVGMHKLGIRCT
eukprot:365734-Chlamydomonas_euryale.AAC.35